ncbi:hypothetical protein EMIHUDRAFT_255536 [Emiliania huxleyi CCMP1516]|uniref:Tudor domain-containing protein n=2 Tax=Emiliania huxleyi TaxID=2903 RepID=A0A0D3J9H7_EMIH1|nr:hypothetical protein EMIHUDRAFT_255536 [Emiliania huxleyi CCMP1516]EOD20162.1 hypothetical protein EMIHUDRAFT_255536 [Emiliania huxleyi CCMP1516]|eukprot:XP_005772591.1 hypothetical protein EMIHUDRAFT_255536 [Emiliania huxleyi CCMP1516]
MPSPDAAARHTGAGVARRQAHHERMRDERAREAAAGDAELPPEDDAVEMASAVHVLDSVAEVGPNYTLLRSKETKAKRRKRKREDARAALDGHTVLSTGSRLEIFCDSERWYPATVMAREEDRDGRIVHEVEYDGYSDRRWWHMLDDERWRAVPEQAGAGAGGAAADGDGDVAMDRVDGEHGARAAGDAEAAEVRAAPPPVRRGVRRSALADALQAEDDEQQDEAARGDGRPMLAPHGPALSAHLIFHNRRQKKKWPRRIGPPQAAWRVAVEHPSGGPSAPGRRCWRLGRKRPSPFFKLRVPLPLRS